MKVGDILVYTNSGEYASQYYTVGKHYTIIKTDNNFIPEKNCGWIIDDHGFEIYFEEDQATDKHWKYLKELRKEKLEKLKCYLKD